jgi:hypothetical protein
MDNAWMSATAERVDMPWKIAISIRGILGDQHQRFTTP